MAEVVTAGRLNPRRFSLSLRQSSEGVPLTKRHDDTVGLRHDKSS